MSSTDRLRAACALGLAALAAGCGDPGWRDRALYEPAYLTNLRVQTGQIGVDVAKLADAFARAAPAPVEFDFDSARVEGPARAALAAKAAWLAANPEAVVAVIGHADRPGAAAYNDRLGLRRAEAARSVLVSDGVAPERIRAVSSLGEESPIVQTGARSRRNRRVELRVVGAGDPAVAFRAFDGERARLSYVEHRTRQTGFPIDIQGVAE